MRLLFRSVCSAALCTAVLGTLLANPANAQNPPRRRRPTDLPPGAPAGAPQMPAGTPVIPQRPAAQPKPYKEVVTAEAKTDKGVLTMHRIEDRLLFEIPASLMGKEMLWQTEIAQVPSGFGYGGTAVGKRVVRWTRRNNKIFLRNVDFSVRSSATGAIAKAVADATLEPVLFSFNVEAEGENKSAVIDVTSLFISDPPEFAAKGRLGASGVDMSRSYIERTKAFPTNVEIRSFLTFSLAGGPPGLIFGGPPRRGSGVSSISAVIHYSIVQLPDNPMKPRLADDRVGYFTEDYQDYGRNENRVVDRSYIARYRLEKKDPSAAVSEPVKPIVYYISREVPEKWRPWMKKGVEQWQEAYEAAGFKNAIICKEAPSEKEDPNWDSEDVRYSVIRWAPTPTENAQGPNVHDPRTGEIISAHVIMYHNILKLLESWYFVQCAALDPRTAKLPLPEPLMGELVQYVVAHEVGHTLGLRHNHKASSSFTVAQLRDKTFTEKWGDEASIMDYGRFNYVAQPGDNARLIPKLGPYDLFAIEWGYKPLPEAKTADDEKDALNKMCYRQVSDPTLRFGGEDERASVDPTVQTEDLGSDPIEATAYGLKNINRIVGMLIPATTKAGEDYSILDDMYGQLLGQRQRELSHVAKLVGGVIENRVFPGQGNEVFRPVAKEKQAQAVKFLLENAFVMPRVLVPNTILSKIKPSGVTDRVLNSQRGLLASLLAEDRVKRLMDAQATQPGQAYTVTQLVTDLQTGIWSELRDVKPVIDIYRRNLQRSYIQQMKPMLTGESATQSELRPLARGALLDLMKTIDRALLKTTDRETSLHLHDSRIAIDRILNPKS